MDVINFFELKSEVDYAPKYVMEERYIYIHEGGNISPCCNFGPETIVDINYDHNIVIIDVQERNKFDKYYECMVLLCKT